MIYYYKKETYSEKNPRTLFKLIGYNIEEDKAVLNINGQIKQYVIYMTKTDKMYFSFRGRRYYLDDYKFR